MPNRSPNRLNREKAGFRRRGLEARRSMVGRDTASRRIATKVRSLPAWDNARVVMCYVSLEFEVNMQDLVTDVLSAGKQLVVPFCDGDQLGMFHLESPAELQPGAMRIPEPRRELRLLPQKIVESKALDLILVPGVAFDRKGDRVGFGKGYYDRLLARVRSNTIKIGLAFECQMFEAVPAGDLDVRMDYVVTELDVYR